VTYANIVFTNLAFQERAGVRYYCSWVSILALLHIIVQVPKKRRELKPTKNDLFHKMSNKSEHTNILSTNIELTVLKVGACMQYFDSLILFCSYLLFCLVPILISFDCILSQRSRIYDLFHIFDNSIIIYISWKWSRVYYFLFFIIAFFICC